MLLSVSPGLDHLRLLTTIMETFRNGFYGVFLFAQTQWSVLLLLLCVHLLGSGMGASAASVPADVTGCGAPEECSSEQLFQECHSRGATENLLCYCSNGLPRACRDVCDSSLTTPVACPLQCQGYVLCKASIGPAAGTDVQLGWPGFVAIFGAVAALVAGLVLAYWRRKDLKEACSTRSRRTGEPEGDSVNGPVLSGCGVQEDAVHNSQETCPPGDQTSGPVVPAAPSSAEPAEVTALL